MSSVARIQSESWRSVPEPTPRVADHTIHWLEERGVKRIYGIPGGTISPFYDGLVHSTIEAVICQHEGMAGYMASGEALEGRSPGVVAVTSGPGVLNTVTPVAAAYHDEIPLLVLAGEVRRPWQGRGALQDGGPAGLDLRHMFMPVTRFQDEITQPERMFEVLERAWSAAMQHPRGPALVRIPVDVGSHPIASIPQWRSSSEGAGVDVEAVQRAARILEQAERPAILVGVGARSAAVGSWVERLAYRLRIPIMSDIEGKSVVPDTERLYVGQVGLGQSPAVEQLLERGIDVLLTVGARLDDTSTMGFDDRIQPTEALVQLDHDRARMSRAWPASVQVLGDLRKACELLVDACALPSVRCTLSRRDRVESLRATAAPDVPAMDQAPFDPRSVVVAMRSAWPSATFFTDIGNHLLFAARHTRSNRTGDFHASIGLAGMGCGIGSAMGMAAARGGRGEAVVCICGDGGLLMVGSELATAAKHRIPVVLCVFDDGRHGMVDDGMTRLYGKARHSELPDVSLMSYASSLGVRVVDVQCEADLAPPADLDGPLVLRVPIDRSVRPDNPRFRALTGSSDD